MPARNCWAGPDRGSSPANETMQLLITRPQAEAEALSQRLAEMGHKALIEPMLTIRTLPDAVLELDAAAALLLSS